MNQFNPETKITPRILATDLDGTLIPLPENKCNILDLDTIKLALVQSKFEIIFATGRHHESVLEAIETYRLPKPDWVVCDVGSAIYERKGNAYEPYQIYEAHLRETVGNTDRAYIEKLLHSIKGLEPQPEAHQQMYKISYQSSADSVDTLVNTVNKTLREFDLPYACMGSVDPFLNCGLLDVMPRGISKAYALVWLSTHADFSPHEVIYSGDSGNDYAALVSGFRAIIVANHSKGLYQKVKNELTNRGLADRLYLSDAEATSGVLKGIRHFGLI